MMKKKMLFLTTGTLLLLSAACRKKNAETSNTQFEQSSGKIAFRIPPLDQSGTEYGLAFIKHRISLDSLAMRARSSYNRDNLKSITLRSCILYMENEPNALSLGHFSSLKLEALTNFNVLAASLSTIKDSFHYTLTIPGKENQNLLASVANDSLLYRLGGITRRSTSDTLRCTAEFFYSISVSGQ